MKRRNFLAMIPFVVAVCCKPKSKGTFEPYVPEEPDDHERHLEAHLKMRDNLIQKT